MLQLAVPDIAARVDAASLRQLESTLIPDDLRKSVEDVLYEGLIDGDAELSVFVLVAHQSRADPLMAHRVHTAMCRLHGLELRRQQEGLVPPSEQRLRPVIPLVIHTGPRPWAMRCLGELFRPMDALRRFIPRFDIELLDLATIAEEALLAENSALACFLNLFRAQYQSAEGYARSLARSLQRLEAYAPNAAIWEGWLRFSVLFSFQRRDREEWDSMKEVVRGILGEKERGVGETIADYLLRQGREAGLEAGREAGRLEGARAMLASILAVRFPDKSAEDIERALAGLGGAAEAEELGRRLAGDAMSWDELWA